MAKLNGQNLTVKESGKSYSKNFNGLNEGGGSRPRYSAYNDAGERIGAVVPTSNTHGKVYQDGKVIGSIKMNED